MSRARGSWFAPVEPSVAGLCSKIPAQNRWYYWALPLFPRTRTPTGDAGGLAYTYMGSHIFVKIYDPVYNVANSYKQHNYHPYNGPNNHNAA